MAIRNSINDPAVRKEQQRKARGRHPLLKIGSKHTAVWDAIVSSGNPKGGITSAQLRSICDDYHPQILADLKKAYLVTERGKIGNNKKYIADPNGKGIISQQVTVEVELYETENGEFVTRTRLYGRVDNPGVVNRFLGSRKITLDVPPTALASMASAITPDPQYDPYETARAKQRHGDVNVRTIEGEAYELRPVNGRLTVYDANKEDGCIIDQ